MTGLPPIARATLALAGGLTLGFRLPVPDGGGLFFVSLLLLGTALLALRSRIPELAAVVAGVLVGIAGLRSAECGCLSALPDGARVGVFGVMAGAPLPDASVPFLLRGFTEVPTARCHEYVRARLSDRAVAAGVEVRATGLWLQTPDRGPWPRPTLRTGTLVLEDIVPTGERGDLLLRTRGGLQLRMRRLFGHRAPLAEALLLARKEGLDPERRERFARAGLSHVLAISGLHVAIIFGLAVSLGAMTGVGRTAVYVVAGLLTLGYVAFLGAPHSAVRATLMILLFVVARILQRPADPFALLAAAAAAILVLDPFGILDVGFQLSFAGAVGIVALRGSLRTRLARLPGPIRDGLVTGVAATLATAPVAAFHFGRVAPIGVLSNLVAIPLLGLAVPATALAVMTDVVSHGPGQFLAGGAGVLLGLLDATAGVAGAVPFGHAYVPRGTALALGLAGLTAVAVARGTRFTPRRMAVALLLAAWLVTGQRAAPGRNGSVEVHAIDVGQGDAIAVRSPRGRWILVDAGPRSEDWDAGRARVVPYLLERGVDRLEALVLTHPDGDHVGGAAAVLEALSVGAVLDPGRATGKPLYLELLGTAKTRETRWFAARAGRRLELDGVTVQLLYPEAGSLDASESANDISVVVRLEYGAFSALLMGDAPAAVEQYLVARHGTALEAELVKVGHHGSGTSTTAALLDAATPSVALIPVGRRNRYGHPHPGVLDRLQRRSIRILRTDRNGSVVVRGLLDGTIEVETTR